MIQTSCYPHPQINPDCRLEARRSLGALSCSPLWLRAGRAELFLIASAPGHTQRPLTAPGGGAAAPTLRTGWGTVPRMKRSHVGRTSVVLVWMRTFRLYSATPEPSSRLTSNKDGFWGQGKSGVRGQRQESPLAAEEDAEPMRGHMDSADDAENHPFWRGALSCMCTNPGGHPCPRPPHSSSEREQGCLPEAAAALPTSLPQGCKKR